MWKKIMICCVLFMLSFTPLLQAEIRYPIGIDINWARDSGARVFKPPFGGGPASDTSAPKLDSDGNVIYAARMPENEVTVRSVSPEGKLNWRQDFNVSNGTLFFSISSDGNVYVYMRGSSTPDKRYFHLYAVDSHSGDVMWDRNFDSPCEASVRKEDGVNVYCHLYGAYLNGTSSLISLSSNGDELGSLTVHGELEGPRFNSIINADLSALDVEIPAGWFVARDSDTIRAYNEYGQLSYTIPVEEVAQLNTNVWQIGYYVFDDGSILLRSNSTSRYYDKEGEFVWSRDFGRQLHFIYGWSRIYYYDNQSKTLYKINRTDGSDEVSYTADGNIKRVVYDVLHATGSNIINNDAVFVATETSLMIELDPDQLIPLLRFPYIFSSSSAVEAAIGLHSEHGIQPNVSRIYTNVIPSIIDIKRKQIYYLAGFGDGQLEGTINGLFSSKLSLTDLVNHPVESDMLRLYSQGVLSIPNDGLVHPDTNITKEDFIVMLTRSLTGGIQIKGPTFKDIPEDRWSYPWIEKAVAYRILDKGEGQLNPDQLITSGECAVMAAKAAYLLKFPAFSAKPVVYSDQEYIEAANKAKFLDGIANFSASQTITKAQAASIIIRVMDFKDDELKKAQEQMKQKG
ncbi:hypothetical protein SAMN03159341_12132 [Paenibacillus sp. 1_12]|uniref:hypothetical protein n=1 Tax=Paenibacillus sp. 1_12 TaxID=1566278 RepID=UPI0008F20AB2|nr:hypothetical protein [Paenibacillus sp. 1_12]SFM22333.1 hypothetical protein SAMN03159341_12132 [Paenibacillus sp. 1_12]